MEMHTCGVREQLGDRAEARAALQTNRPFYYVRSAPRGFTVDQIAEVYERAFAGWTSVANVDTRRITDLAQAGPRDVVNVIDGANLGTSGVLADQVLGNGQGTRLQMRINNQVDWSRINMVTTVMHEQGHFFGLAHFPPGPPPELMEPVLSSVLKPQPTEAKVVREHFANFPPIPGPEPIPPTPVPPKPTPPPTPVPPGDIPVDIRTAAHTALNWLTSQLKEAASKTPAFWDDAAVGVFDRFDSQLLDILLDRLLASWQSNGVPANVSQAMMVIANARKDG
jgi:hypothetical protein